NRATSKPSRCGFKSLLRTIGDRTGNPVEHLRQASRCEQLKAELASVSTPDFFQRDELVRQRVGCHTKQWRRPAWLELNDDGTREPGCVLELRFRSRARDRQIALPSLLDHSKDKCRSSVWQPFQLQRSPRNGHDHMNVLDETRQPER